MGTDFPEKYCVTKNKLIVTASIGIGDDLVDKKWAARGSPLIHRYYIWVKFWDCGYA
jgi:hypothetical protein